MHLLKCFSEVFSRDRQAALSILLFHPPAATAAGDEEFWEQEFFAEEHKDEEYSAASDSSDTADSDISKSVRTVRLCTPLRSRCCCWQQCEAA